VQISVRLHGVLSRYADGNRHLDVEVANDGTVDDVLTALAVRYPGVERRVRDETGTVRPHINLFVDGTQLRELGGVAHRPPPGAELLILPAVSGG
jgi:sulfur-carrier protein